MATSKQEKTLRELGVRSGLEDVVQEYLTAQGVAFGYESHAIPYTLPPKKYTPDFFLPNGIVIETKGYFPSNERTKMRMVKKQHPELDLRIVFESARTPLTTQKNTEFTKWARREGIRVPKTGPARDAIKGRFFDWLRANGKPVPSQTTYGMWAARNGFPYAEKLPPVEWLREPPNEASIEVLRRIMK